jgi:predicted TIM-barrel fold metal-dependent hydrolase
MMIVDSQVHIWAADTPERPWPAGQAGRAHQSVPLTAEGLLEKMDAAGVARAMLVPPSWEGDRNDVVLAAAHRYPDRFAVMGRLSLEAPASRDEFLPLTRTDGMLGCASPFTRNSSRSSWVPPTGSGPPLPLRGFR